MKLANLTRFSLSILGLTLLWQGVISTFDLPAYILPSPLQVFTALHQNFSLIAHESGTTLLETLLGLILGTAWGCMAAILISLFRPLSIWLLPLMIISQALPSFAVAPLLVIWLGYGLASKVAVTVLMIFFPITNAFYDGLRQTERAWLDLGQTMTGQRWKILWYIRIPAALPNLASGLRLAAVIAPLGAIIGEWVGASHGLGYLMLNANARMQIDFMFATLIVVTLFTLTLYFGLDYGLKKCIHWQPAKV